MVKHYHFLLLFSLFISSSIYGMELPIQQLWSWRMSTSQPMQSKKEAPHFQITLDQYDQALGAEYYDQYQKALAEMKEDENAACSKLYELKQQYVPAKFALWCYYDRKIDEALALSKPIKPWKKSYTYLSQAAQQEYPPAQMQLGLQCIQARRNQEGFDFIQKAAEPRMIEVLFSSLLIKSALESDQIDDSLPEGIYTGFYYHHPAITYLAQRYFQWNSQRPETKKYVSLAYQVTGDDEWLKKLDLINRGAISQEEINRRLKKLSKK